MRNNLLRPCRKQRDPIDILWKILVFFFFFNDSLLTVMVDSGVERRIPIESVVPGEKIHARDIPPGRISRLDVDALSFFLLFFAGTKKKKISSFALTDQRRSIYRLASRQQITPRRRLKVSGRAEKRKPAGRLAVYPRIIARARERRLTANDFINVAVRAFRWTYCVVRPWR